MTIRAFPHSVYNHEMQLHQLLLDADDPEDTEAPKGFVWNEAIAEVRSLQPGIEAILGSPLDRDENVQDAAFFTELALHTPAVIPPSRDTVFAIRFSAFGRLVTFWSVCPPERQLPEDLWTKVAGALEARGFHYIPSPLLNEPYGGTHPYFQGSSWWARFFDYN